MWRSGGHHISRALRNHALRVSSASSSGRIGSGFAAPLAVATAAAAALAWTLADASDPYAHARAAAAAKEPVSATLHLPPPAAASAGIVGVTAAANGNNPTGHHPAAAVEKMHLTRRFTRRRQKRAHTFVIVGSGTTAHAAIEAIRQEDPLADILVLSDEIARPRMDTDLFESSSEQIAEPLMETYNEWRRHLTAKLEDEPNESANTSNSNGSNTSNAQHAPPLTLLLDKTDIRFDVERNRIHLGDGTEIRYAKCLIASSGKPRHFYVLDRHRISYALKDRINLCTTPSDFAQLDQLHRRSGADAVQSVVVIGGGFLGTEVATALATDPRNAHIQTRLVFTESAPTSRSLPLYLAHELAARLQRVGVDIVADHLVTSLKCEENQDSEESEVTCTHVVIDGLGQGNKSHSVADFVVLASTHTDPNLRFGRDTGFEVDEATGGIVVNAQFEAISGLFVAGNAASYFDPYLGRRRVDRYDHAVNSGLVAGRNMVASLAPATGRMKNYRHQPMFRSNLRGIDVVIEGIGEIDASLHTVGVWVQPPSRSGQSRPTQSHQGLGGHASSTPPASFDRGVVYYLKGNKIMGILLWNASDVLESAKQLLLSRPEMHDNVLDELEHAISIAPSDWLHVVTT